MTLCHSVHHPLLLDHLLIRNNRWPCVTVLFIICCYLIICWSATTDDPVSQSVVHRLLLFYYPLISNNWWSKMHQITLHCSLVEMRKGHTRSSLLSAAADTCRRIHFPFIDWLQRQGFIICNIILTVECGVVIFLLCLGLVGLLGWEWPRHP